MLAALGPELARKPLSVRKRIEVSLEAYRERLPHLFPVRRGRKTGEVQVVVPQYGRSVDDGPRYPDPRKREQMLMEAREFFIKCFAEK